MSSLTHLFEFKVNGTLFQSEAELNTVKQKINEILRSCGFKLLNIGEDAYANPGFLAMYSKEGILFGIVLVLPHFNLSGYYHLEVNPHLEMSNIMGLVWVNRCFKHRLQNLC